jgi:hypothetical protein
MRYYWQSALVACMVFFFSFGNEILNVSYPTADLLVQNGAIFHPDVQKTNTPIECFDMGTTGNIEIPNVALPQGPFSIEGKFFLRSYKQTDPNISGILEGFACDYGNTGAGNTEGVEFRVGGGYQYPLINDLGASYSIQSSAAISKAIGEFGLGVGQHIWKEVYTNCSIVTNQWIHMAATWDGTNMLVYLNGREATDSWRTVGAQLKVLIANSRTVFIGSENASAGRHFDGMIAYAKVYNQALSRLEIWDKYRESLGKDRCDHFIRIESPRCGEVISCESKIKFSVRDSLDNDVTTPGQVFSVWICREPTFSDSSARIFKTTSRECFLKDLAGTNNATVDCVYYFRISADNPAGLSKKADAGLMPESGTVPTYLVNSPIKVVPRAVLGSAHKGKTSISRFDGQIIYDVRGRSVGVGSKTGLSNLKYGVYFVKTQNSSGQKMLFVK